MYLLQNGRASYVNQYLYKHADVDYDDLFFVDDDEEEAVYAAVNCSAHKIPNDAKVDCGYNGINSTQCVQQGCCWFEIHNNPNNDPWCYFANVCSAASAKHTT